jgi:hypothetical protein
LNHVFSCSLGTILSAPLRTASHERFAMSVQSTNLGRPPPCHAPHPPPPSQPMVAPHKPNRGGGDGEKRGRKCQMTDSPDGVGRSRQECPVYIWSCIRLVDRKPPDGADGPLTGGANSAVGGEGGARRHETHASSTSLRDTGRRRRAARRGGRRAGWRRVSSVGTSYDLL